MKLRRLITKVGVLLSVAMPGGLGLDFSADGRMIAVTHPGKPGMSSNIVAIPIDGGAQRPVTTSGKASFPVWSPDGTRIAFIDSSSAEARPGAAGDIHVYDMQSRRTRRFVGEYEPPIVWREDGRRLACIRRTKDGQVEIAQLNSVEGGVINHFVMPVASGRDFKMVWLPNTDNVALFTDTGGKGDIWTMEDGEPHQITKTGDVIGMSLSADKSSLVWVRRGPNLKYILLSMYAYNLDERSVARVPFPDRVAALNPNPRQAPSSLKYATISRDGSRMLLIAETVTAADPKKKLPASSTIDCYLIRTDGTSAKRVRQVKKLPGAFIIPFWSPTGQFALTLADGKTTGVELYGSDGTRTSIVASVAAP